MDGKSLYSIIVTVVITALIAGGVGYFSQKSKSLGWQSDLISQQKENGNLEQRISDLENQIADLQNKNTESDSKTADSPELTNSIVLSLLKNDLPKYLESSSAMCLAEGVEGGYGSCEIDIIKTNNQWSVVITYNKLADDSIQATRVKTTITYSNGNWIKGKVSKDQKCQPNRGHQDFSSENCI